MHFNITPHGSRGFGLIEMIVGIAVLSLAFLALTHAYRTYIRAGLSNTEYVQAAFLIEEGLEAVRLMRDGSWTNLSTLSTGTDYYLAWNGTTWVSTATPQMIDEVFARTVRLDPVYRDSNQDIAASGTLDASTKKITVSVSWLSGDATTTEQLSTYITNMFQ